jgi:hypothetical protein
MDRALLQANLDVTRAFVHAAPGIYVPNLYFDVIQRKIVGAALVDPETLKEMNSEALKKELSMIVGRTWVESSLTFKDIKNPMDADFVIEFRALRDSGEYYVFADWKNGVLSVH